MENNEKSLPAQMRENLARLRELGVEPYPRRSARTHTAEAVVADFEALEGAEVTVAGRLMAIRRAGYGGGAHVIRFTLLRTDRFVVLPQKV